MINSKQDNEQNKCDVEETKNICKRLPNTRTSIILDDGEMWEPQNSDGKETESEPLWRALALSMNNVTVNIMKQLDPNAPKVVKEMALSMSIKNHLEEVYTDSVYRKGKKSIYDCENESWCTEDKFNDRED